MFFFSRPLITMALVLGCTLSAIGGSIRYNLDTDPAKIDQFIIIVGNVPEKSKNTEVRQVVIERVLNGPILRKGQKASIAFDKDSDLKAGYYILILEYNNEQLFFGYNRLILTPFVNDLPLTSAEDPVINDVALIIDTAKITVPGLKWQRLQEMAIQMKDRPAVMLYVIDAQSNIVRQTQQGFINLLTRILNHSGDYPLAVVISSDKTLIGQGADVGKKWESSAERKAIFTDLKINTPKDDPSYPYIENVLRAFDK